MQKRPCVPSVGLIFFFFFYIRAIFGVSFLTSAYAGHYTLNRGCACVWPVYFPTRQRQLLTLGHGTLSSSSIRLHVLPERLG